MMRAIIFFLVLITGGVTFLSEQRAPQLAQYTMTIRGSAIGAVGFRFNLICPLPADQQQCTGELTTEDAQRIQVAGVMRSGASSTIWSVEAPRADLQCTFTEFHRRHQQRGVPPRYHAIHIACAAAFGFVIVMDGEIVVESTGESLVE